jgi:putative membrane protein
MYYASMMGMHFFWWIFLIAIVVGLLFWGRSNSASKRGPSLESAQDALKRRLANSEISIEEYEQRKAVLDRDSRI